MKFLAILAAAVVITVVCKRPIKAHPWVFYLIATLLSALYFANRVYGVPPMGGLPQDLMLATIQKGSLGVAFFVIVMYVGVFGHSSKAYAFLNPIRGELSIIAWLLVLGHVAFYGMSYLPKMFGVTAFKDNVVFSLVCGILLFVLLMVLGVTSIKAVRRAMSAKTWKRVQAWAYLFYALVYGHMVAILLPSALKGGATAVSSVLVYTVVFGLYLVLRICRAVKNKQLTHGKPPGGDDNTPVAEAAEA